MAQHNPRVGVGPTPIHGAAMAGTHMPGMSGMSGHVDSAAGDIGYKPETHERYRPQAGRADKHAGNVLQDAYLAGNV